MLAIFDVEGVLVDGEFLPSLARLVGREREVEEITLKGIRGEIRWEEGLFMRIGAVKGVSYDDCLRVADGMPLMKGAVEACRELKARGWRLVAVSGGFTLLGDRVKRELDLDYTVCNRLVFNAGKLVNVDLRVSSDKAGSLLDVMKRLDENESTTAAGVDGANDLKLFDLASVRVAFNAQPIVNKHANHIIKEKDLTLLLPILDGMPRRFPRRV